MANYVDLYLLPVVRYSLNLPHHKKRKPAKELLFRDKETLT